MSSNFPPSAAQTIYIDFDGTLYPFVGLFDYPRPKEGAVEGVKRLKEAGYEIWIYSSRLSSLWLMESRSTFSEHIQYISDICKRDGILFDGITGQKNPAKYYIDDRAIEFKDNWNEIIERILHENG